MRRRVLTLLVLLLTLSTPLWTRGNFTYALDLSDSYYPAIAHFADEIPMRSSNATALSLGIVGYETDDFSVSLDVHSMFVTPSIPFGNYQNRGFNSVGLRIRGGYQINNIVGIFGSISGEVNYYRKIKEAFISYSLQIGPQFRILQTTLHTIDITIPVTIHLRKEITAPMIGVGLRYSLALLKEEDRP